MALVPQHAANVLCDMLWEVSVTCWYQLESCPSLRAVRGLQDIMMIRKKTVLRMPNTIAVSAAVGCYPLHKQCFKELMRVHLYACVAKDRKHSQACCACLVAT